PDPHHPALRSTRPPRMSGANTLGPLKSAPIRTLRPSYEPRTEPRTDLGSAYSHSRPHLASRYRQRLSRRCSPLSLLPPHCLSAGTPAQPAPPRSPSARLVPLLVRET